MFSVVDSSVSFQLNSHLATALRENSSFPPGRNREERVWYFPRCSVRMIFEPCSSFPQLGFDPGPYAGFTIVLYPHSLESVLGPSLTLLTVFSAWGQFYLPNTFFFLKKYILSEIQLYYFSSPSSYFSLPLSALFMSPPS